MLLDQVTFAYGEKRIFDRFSLTLEEGEITAVLGASGVGKSTLLRLIAGLSTPTAGSVPACRASYMFQEPRLLPTLDVLHNLTAIPDISEERARLFLTAVGLEDDLRSYPGALSGGMAQRVSMARAFAYPSDLLLMDEPFKGLDLSLRTRLYEVFLSLWRERRLTTVLVTHDTEEAVALASRVVVLAGTPATVAFDARVDAATQASVHAALREALMQV